jgi:signal transduction histidine kinase
VTDLENQRRLGQPCLLPSRIISLYRAVKTLRIDSSGATLEIRDDGKGMPKNVLASGGGTGIRGLAERTSHLDGTLQVRSDGNGTVITATLPFSAPR